MSSGATTSAGSALSPASFSIGEPQWTTVGATGCGTNGDGEPAIHVSLANDVFLGSEEGLGNGSDAWRDLGGVGGSGAQACSLEYRGQPNALVPGLGLSGGDIDLAWASAPNAQRTFNLYVASLNGASVAVAHSSDRGTTFTNVPVQRGLPLDDRLALAAGRPPARIYMAAMAQTDCGQCGYQCRTYAEAIASGTEMSTFTNSSALSRPGVNAIVPVVQAKTESMIAWIWACTRRNSSSAVSICISTSVMP